MVNVGKYNNLHTWGKAIAKDAAERERRRIRNKLAPVLKRMRSMFPDDSYLEGELMIEHVDAATRAPRKGKR
jgi:hypothetical protein